MNHDRSLFIIMSLVALACVGGLQLALAGAGTDPGPARADQDPAADAASPAGESTIVVYYFHGKRRCKTCLTLEAYTEEALQTWFGEELRGGKIEWHSVNFDDPENEHYIEDFQLPSSSVVVAEMHAGKTVRFQTLPKAWSLVGDKQGFSLYVTQAVRGFLD